jgi:hypothetical protein
MGAFELQDTHRIHADGTTETEVMGKPPEPVRIKDECVIALKVYDSCRNQNCLTPAEIGPSRAAKDTTLGEESFKEGEIIIPPKNAASVTVDNLRIKRIIIVDKQPSPFRNGYWDADIKFVFEYRLTFREVDGGVISKVNASNIFNMKVTLFGSMGSDLVVGTDLLTSSCDTVTFDSAPFIWVEAKAISLNAKIHRSHQRDRGCDERCRCERCSGEVHVTLGLFSIIKLFRLVHLNVQSKGFCVPEECCDGNPICPCDYFEDLDFPMDVFSPPQKPEYLAGVSNNIPPCKKD